jgi:hypothetical protein
MYDRLHETSPSNQIQPMNLAKTQNFQTGGNGNVFVAPVFPGACAGKILL